MHGDFGAVLARRDPKRFLVRENFGCNHETQKIINI